MSTHGSIGCSNTVCRIQLQYTTLRHYSVLPFDDWILSIVSYLYIKTVTAETLTFEQFDLLMNKQLINLSQVLEARRYSGYRRRSTRPLRRCAGTRRTCNRLT